MKELTIKPTILSFNNIENFFSHFNLGKKDLLITGERLYNNFLKSNIDETNSPIVVLRENFGSSEPTDVMVEKIYEYIKDKQDYERVIAVGGGSILDIAKLFCLEKITPVCDLFEHNIKPIKNKQLILIPTTCGTGSEVTNISILELTKTNTKLGLAADELYADYAILIPQLLECMPFKVFVTSSIDAFIHAIESYLSVNSSRYTQSYSKKAMSIIINGYQTLIGNGNNLTNELLNNFLIASNYAGIAFGNAGCGAVHALSYPLGAKYHIPHGESNYAVFTGVFHKYMQLDPYGKINELNEFLSGILECPKSKVYTELDNLMNHLLKKKRLSEYGIKKDELYTFTESVMTKQQRLMSNNYAKLSDSAVLDIYQSLY